MANYPTEKGTLPIGLEYAGKVHNEVEIRPIIMKDRIEVRESAWGDRAAAHDDIAIVCMLAKRLLKIGDVPADAITPDLLVNLTDADLNYLIEMSAELEARLARPFRDGRDGNAGETKPAGEANS